MTAPRPKPEAPPQAPRHEGGVKPSAAQTPPAPQAAEKPDEGAADRGREGGMIGEG